MKYDEWNEIVEEAFYPARIADALREAVETTEKLHSLIRRIKVSASLQDAMVYVDAAIKLLGGTYVEEKRDVSR